VPDGDVFAARLLQVVDDGDVFTDDDPASVVPLLQA